MYPPPWAGSDVHLLLPNVPAGRLLLSHAPRSRFEAGRAASECAASRIKACAEFGVFSILQKPYLLYSLFLTFLCPLAFARPRSPVSDNVFLGYALALDGAVASIGSCIRGMWDVHSHLMVRGPSERWPPLGGQRLRASKLEAHFNGL